MNETKLVIANQILLKGGIIAYPTEAVFGLGCDPFNQSAVEKIYRLKKRNSKKALLLIAANWDQVKDFTTEIPDEKLTAIKKTWPGPYTWIFPISPKAPKYILGDESGIAIRITDHPIAKKLCENFGPIVSTSANPEGKLPAKTATEVANYFGDQIDYIVEGELGNLKNPTEIRHALTDNIVRNN